MTNSPNLLIVYPDQMRGQALGFLGEEPVRTPHLDRFAAQSLVLPQAAASYPVCSPSRAMWMTGAYPWTSANTVHGNCTSRSAPYGVELPVDARCWSDVLHEQGYDLGYVGKWHLTRPTSLISTVPTTAASSSGTSGARRSAATALTTGTPMVPMTITPGRSTGIPTWGARTFIT